MSPNAKLVPTWVRIFVGLLALANIAFGILNYFGASALFQNNTAGIDLMSNAAKFASYEFGARNLAIGLALLIVSIVGVPETIAIMTIVRALVELQSVVIGIISGNFGIGMVVSIIIFAIETFIIANMFRIVGERDHKK
ncbi:MAG: hypothetical protein U0X74_07920 [Anaerolineales bacterium]